MRLYSFFFLLLLLPAFQSCAKAQKKTATKQESSSSMQNLELATFGGGCFWCIEAVFDQLQGVEKALSGYSGGQIENPTYKAICTGTTGHAEVVQIHYNPELISYSELLEVFWTVHDPTTLNRQGADVGTQYRSVIFYHNEEQKQLAEASVREEQKNWQDPIVTELSPAPVFYEAEDYHQEYYELNGNKNPYCSAVITPKVKKFRKLFQTKLKED